MGCRREETGRGRHGGSFFGKLESGVLDTASAPERGGGAGAARGSPAARSARFAGGGGSAISAWSGPRGPAEPRTVSSLGPVSSRGRCPPRACVLPRPVSSRGRCPLPCLLWSRPVGWVPAARPVRSPRPHGLPHLPEVGPLRPLGVGSPAPPWAAARGTARSGGARGGSAAAAPTRPRSELPGRAPTPGPVFPVPDPTVGAESPVGGGPICTP